jgi:Heliorhodopsin
MWDVISLVLLMSVNACMNLFGLLFETMNINKPTIEIDWTPFWFGCFAGAVPWAAVFAYVGGTSQLGASTGNNIPAFVWVILFAYLIFFNTFPVNMGLQYSKGAKWYTDEYWGFSQGGYMYGEKVYQVLSLISKSLLLWLVIGGVNQPSSYNQ